MKRRDFLKSTGLMSSSAAVLGYTKSLNALQVNSKVNLSVVSNDLNADVGQTIDCNYHWC